MYIQRFIKGDVLVDSFSDLGKTLPLHLLLDVQIHVLIHAHILQLLLILPQLDQLVHLLRLKVWSQMSLKLLQYLRLRFLPPQLMSQRGLHHRLLEYRPIFQRHGKSVRYGTHVGIVVGSCEFGVFDTGNTPPQFLNKGRRGGLGPIGIICGVETAKDEHGGYHVLDAMIAVGEVVHGFMLFVDDTDAGFVGAAGDGFDVFCRFALL